MVINESNSIAPLARKMKSVDYGLCSRYQYSQVNTQASCWKQFFVSNQKHENKCWLNAILITLSGVRNESTKKNWTEETIEKKYQEYITLKGLDDSEGLNYDEISNFFMQIKLNHVIVDKNAVFLIDKVYSPKNITFYAMLHNNHVYLLNNEINAIRRRNDEVETVSISSDFSVKPRKIGKVYGIHSMNDVVDVVDQVLKERRAKSEEVLNPVETNQVLNPVATNQGGENEMITCIDLNNDLESKIGECYKVGYEPLPFMASGKISSLHFNIKDGRNIVRLSLIDAAMFTNVEADKTMEYDTLTEFNNCKKVSTEAFNEMFQYGFRSNYSESDLTAFKQYGTKPVSMYLKEECKSAFKQRKPETMSFRKEFNLVEIDIRRHYTALLKSITHVPIFNIFDSWKIYRNQRIEPLTLYKIETEDHVLETQKYETCYGYNLVRAKPKRILEYKKPSAINETKFNDVVENVYKSTISDYKKKDIVNVLIGLLGKSVNKKQTAQIHKSIESATYQCIQEGGIIYEIDKQSNALDYGLGDEDETFENYYIVQNTNKQELLNGFKFIKEMIYQNSKYFIKQYFDLLQKHNIQVWSIKTDVFIISKADLQKAQTLLPFGEELGNWRVTKKTDFTPAYCERTFVENDDVLLSKGSKMNVINVSKEMEWETKEIIKQLKHLTLILGNCAGAGKSYIGMNMEDTLLVCPTQQLKDDFISNKVNAITCHEFFGLKAGADVSTGMRDYSKFKSIVFEEIYFNSVDMIQRIYFFMLKNSHMCLATGDVYQLKSVQTPNNISDHLYKSYMEQVMNTVFENVITLTQNKRCKTETDQLKAQQLKIDIFNGVSRKKIIEKHFKFTNKYNSKKNLAFTNAKCALVSRIIRTSDDFEEGDGLICRAYLKEYSGIHRNCTYKVIGVYDTFVAVIDSDGKEVDIPFELVKKNFIFDTCRTVHSSQGVTIKGQSVTVFEWNKCTREWFYVACTRVDAFENLYFFDETFEEHDYDFTSKINGYKAQDEKAGRIVTDRYISSKWINACEPVCFHCMDKLDMNEITIDRMDNNIGHEKQNCVISCLACNRAHLNEKVFN
jgi:hypothetical protein